MDTLKNQKKEKDIAKSFSEKYKKKKKKSKLESNSSNILNKYNQMETKSNVNNSILKTLVDVVASMLVGPALSATLGKFAPIAGTALSFGGHYTGEQSALLRGIGMSAIAHSVAKTKEYRDPNSNLKDRFSGLKDDWLRLIMMKGNDELPNEVNGIENSVEIVSMKDLSTIYDPDSENQIEKEPNDYNGNIDRLDLTSLEQFEEQLELSADEFQEQQQMDTSGLFNEDHIALDNFNGSPYNQSKPDIPDDFDFSLM